MPICWLHAIFFRWPNPSRPSAALSSGKANTQTSFLKSLTARECGNRHLCRFGKQRLEESLFGSGLPQGGVTINMGRQPTFESFGLEDRPMNRVVVAHRSEGIGEPALALGIEIGPRGK